MKKVIWTKADAKRARDMGWHYSPDRKSIKESIYSDSFRSDDETIKWVINFIEAFSTLNRHYNTNYPEKVNKHWLQAETCRKALFLCAKG